MAKKTQVKRSKQQKLRETLKRGGTTSVKHSIHKRTQTIGIIEELMELALLNQDISTKIHNKVEYLRGLYTDDSSNSQKTEEEEESDTINNRNSIGSVEETNNIQYDPLLLLPDIESVTTNAVYDERSVGRNYDRINLAKPGTWDFYILQTLDDEPKTETEITELMVKNYPDKMKGKTPENTLNYRLQKLVKDGRAKRIEFKKGKRTVYRYFI